MSYFDSGSKFFCRSEAEFDAGANEHLAQDPVAFAHELRRREPHDRKVTFETTTHRRQVGVDIAREKWGPVSFKNDEAVRFRHKLSEKIIELRKELSLANTQVTFPDHISQEATGFAPPKYGLKWEIFDVKKHADYEALQELQRRKKLAQERVAYEKALTSLRDANIPSANSHGLSMAWGEILSSDM